MPQFDIFKLSDSDKERKLFDLLNPITQDGMDRVWNCCIVQVYDKYAVIRTYGRGECEGKFERVFYTKNDETDTIEITGREVCYMMDVSEQEKRILDTLYAGNNNTFENLDQKFEASTNNLEELNTKIVEYENQNSTLTIENERLNGEVAELTNKFNDVSDQLSSKEAAFSLEKEEMQKQINSLNEFKLGVVRQSKKDIIHGYDGILSEEILETFEAKLDNYDEEQLDMLLTYEVKKQNPSAFGSNIKLLIPKEQPLTGLEAVLSKYRDRK